MGTAHSNSAAFVSPRPQTEQSVTPRPLASEEESKKADADPVQNVVRLSLDQSQVAGPAENETLRHNSLNANSKKGELQATFTAKSTTETEHSTAKMFNETVHDEDDTGNKRSKVSASQVDASAVDVAQTQQLHSEVESKLPNATPSTSTENLRNVTKDFRQDTTLILEALFGCVFFSTTSSLKMPVVRDLKSYGSGAVFFLPGLVEALNAEKNEASSSADSSQLETHDKFVTFDDVELIVTLGVRLFLQAGSPLYLRWLNDCYARCSEDFINGSLSLLKAWKTLDCSKHLDFEETRSVIANYGALSLQCPEYFLDCNVPLDFPQEKPRAADAVIALLERPQVVAKFLYFVWEEILENGSIELTTIINPVLDHLNNKLGGRHLYNLCTDAINSFTALICSHKKISPIVAASPHFSPVVSFTAGNIPVVIRQLGWILQLQTLIGHILRPNVLDESMLLSDVKQCTRVRCFSSIFTKTQSNVGQTVVELRQQLLNVMETSSYLVTTMCKNGARDACLKWISSVIDTNEKRCQQTITHELFYFSTVSVTMESIALRAHGLSCTGFNLNVFWLLLRLLEPVKFSKVPDIDAGFLLRQDAAPLLGKFTTESCLGSAEELEATRKHYGASPMATSASGFPTQIMFLTLRALRCLFCPALKEYDSLRQNLYDKQAAVNEGRASPTEQDNYEKKFTQLLCYNTVLLHPAFLPSFWRFIRLVVTWLAWAMLSVNDDKTAEAQSLITSDDKRLLLSDSSDHVASVLHKAVVSQDVVQSKDLLILALPYCVFEDLAEAIRFFLTLPADQSSRKNLLTAPIFDTLHLVNEDLLAAFLLFIVRSDSLIRNPHCRWSSGYEPFFHLHTHPILGSRIDKNDKVVHYLIPSIVKCFIDAQKAGYYVRIEQRLFYTRHLEKVLEMECHSEALKQFAKKSENHETFVRFLAMLVESMTWLLEEGMGALAEIKKQEPAQEACNSSSRTGGVPEFSGRSSANLSRAAEHSNNAEEDEEGFDSRGVEEGYNVAEMPFEQLERLCQSLMDGGLRAVKVMALVAKICGDIIVASSVLLPQVVTSLNCCLEHLVGPRCLQLKVSNFEKYNFDPRCLLATTCEIYIALATYDPKDFKRIVTAVCNDTRYYKPNVFTKAYQIVKREGLMNCRNLSSFNQIIQLLQEKASELQMEEQWLAEIWDDVPEEFKDPIMDDLMEDPVKLPTSGHIMDRKNIERHLMTEEFDPFNRMVLKATDLVPQEELRLKIKEFVMEKKEKRKQQFTSSPDNATQ